MNLWLTPLLSVLMLVTLTNREIFPLFKVLRNGIRQNNQTRDLVLCQKGTFL
jgi:hypothetical protein